MANRLLRFSDEGKFVPPDLRPRLETLVHRYRIDHHEGQGAWHNGQLAAELGLLDYLADRYGLLGTPADWLAKLERLSDLGVHQIAIAAMMEDKDGFVEALASEVLPACRSVSDRVQRSS
jgi:hypothetical protein